MTTHRASHSLPRLLAAMCIVFTVLAIPRPASADAYSRQRSGISRWAPQQGSFSTIYGTATKNYFRWTFSWNDSLHYTELNGRHRALELKARTPLGYATEPAGDRLDNFPVGSGGYIDTLVSDDCQGCANFGYGAASANYFLVGATYFASFAVSKTFSTPLVHEITVDIRASSKLSHDCIICANEFSVFNDYTLNVLRPRTVRVLQTDTKTFSWSQNLLFNTSFEQGTAGYTVHPGNNLAVYCNGSGFGSNCYLAFNQGNAGDAAVYQSVSYDVRAGDHYTAEVMLRCPGGQAESCRVGIVYWSMWPDTFEARVAYSIIPPTNTWHICKVDYEHGGEYGFVANHSPLLFEVQSLNANNVHVDYTTLGFYTDRIDGTASDPVPPPASGPVCQPSGQYDL